MTRLLLVEDNQAYRRTLIDILEKEGHMVVGVPDGAAALREAAEQEFAVAIVDLRLPDMTGIEVLKGIGKISPNTEGIMLTGFPCDETIRKAKKLGTYAYMKKTNDVDHRMMLIRKAVELYKTRRELEKLKRLTEELGEGPTGNPGDDEFTAKMREWRGYMTRAIEDFDKRLVSHDGDIGNIFDMIREVNEKVGRGEVKMATVAGGVGVLSAFITSFILSRIGG